MTELTITPLGHLLVRDAPPGTAGPEPPPAVLAAYRDGPARGMLASAARRAAPGSIRRRARYAWSRTAPSPVPWPKT